MPRETLVERQFHFHTDDWNIIYRTSDINRTKILQAHMSSKFQLYLGEIHKKEHSVTY